MTTPMSMDGRPFAELQAPIEKAAEIVGHFHEEIGGRIEAASSALPEIVITEEDFLQSLCRSLRDRFSKDVADYAESQNGIFAETVERNNTAVTEDTSRIEKLVIPRKVFFVTGSLPMRAIKILKNDVEMGIVYLLNPDVTDPEKRLERSSRKLADGLAELTENPMGILVARTLEERRAAFLQATAVKPQIAAKKPKYQDTVQNLETEEVIDITEETVIDIREKKELLEGGTVKLDLAWMGGQTELEYEAVEGAAVVTAMTPQLRAIADKLETNKKHKDRFDRIVATQARRVAAGILPWTNFNGIKKSMGPHRDAFDNIDIYFTRDQSPNAPKIYFSVIATPEEIAMQGAPEHMLVVLAKTDKRHEIDTLQCLTVLSRAALKASNSGSV